MFIPIDPVTDPGRQVVRALLEAIFVSLESDEMWKFELKSCKEEWRWRTIKRVFLDEDALALNIRTSDEDDIRINASHGLNN